MAGFRAVAGGVAAMLAGVAGAWTPPPNDADYADAAANVFRDGEVTRVDVTVEPTDFADLLADPFADVDKNATIRWRNSVIDETVADVGFRPRGGQFTRSATRKSWKLDFNDFVPGRSFHGLESIDLNGEHNDPTFLRRRMSHEILRQMGLPAPRTHFVALYINGDFWSIQVHTEHIDEEFADSWFGTKTGNLYKCLNAGGGKADLAKIPGEDYATYGGGQVYDEGNNDPLSVYTDLVDFIRLLNDTTAAQRLTQLESSLNTDNFLRSLAADVAVGSWDDYWYGANNYYMYRNPNTNRFEFIPFDYDNSLGMDYFGRNWSTRNFSTWGNGGFGSTPAPLVSAIFDHSPWRAQYRRYLLAAAALLVLPANQAKLDTWHAQILPYFDGTIESGGTVGTQSTSGEHSPFFATGIASPSSYDGSDYHTMGLKPYMNARSASIVSQIGGFVSPTLPLPRVSINEALASNTASIQDEAGDFEDWIELYNDEDAAVDVSGWHLTDDVLDPLKWVIPAGTTIPSKGYLLVWCDNEPLEGPLHAPFALGVTGENLGLFMDEANGRVLVDHLTYTPLTNNRSFGRVPDGGDGLVTMCNPTPLAINDGTTGDCGGGEPRVPPRLFINEFLASNSAGPQDEAGDFDDWVEIYNGEATAVELTGLYLTDNLLSRTKWQFPAGTMIPAKGFLLVWCDNEPLEGPLHAAFALSAGGESIGIFDNDANQVQPIDTLTYPAQTANVSQGRLPDGGAGIVTLPGMTPGATNVPAAPPANWKVF